MDTFATHIKVVVVLKNFSTGFYWIIQYRFGGKYKRLNFALPIKKGRLVSLKFFESLKQQHPDEESGTGNVSENNIDETLISKTRLKSDQNSFTMESLILAQDER